MTEGMEDRTVLTVPRGLPLELRARLLRCGLDAVSDAGGRSVSASITPTDIVVEADLN